jgi:hypothetical protein
MSVGGRLRATGIGLGVAVCFLLWLSVVGVKHLN